MYCYEEVARISGSVLTLLERAECGNLNVETVRLYAEDAIDAVEELGRRLRYVSSTFEPDEVREYARTDELVDRYGREFADWYAGLGREELGEIAAEAADCNRECEMGYAEEDFYAQELSRIMDRRFQDRRRGPDANENPTQARPRRGAGL